MKNKKVRYKITRNIATITIIAGLSCALNNYNMTSKPIPFTQQDTITNITFNKELQELLNVNTIEFQNEELYNLIEQTIGEKPTIDNLKQITKLEITEKLTNNDLRDLKYLSNLKELEISNSEIDLNDLKFNQNLCSLTLNNCTFKNTKDIPNTTKVLILTNSICHDNIFITPYFMTSLYLESTPITNLTLKNPQSIETLHIIGDSIIDLNSIKYCNNLKSLTIKLCSNISNSATLEFLNSLETIELDDYATIWLSSKTLSTLPLNSDQKSYLQEQIEQLESIYCSITKPNDSPDEKIKNISLYILRQLTYDENVENNYLGNMEKVYEYNANPISNSLNSNNGICINYACLFKALVNRSGIENYQLFSNLHTWNIVLDENGYKGYDLTYLDDNPIVKLNNGKLAIVSDASVEQIMNDSNENLLYYYEFNLDEITDEDHIAKLTPQEIQEIIINIGYIKENDMIISDNRITKIDIGLKILLIILITNTLINVLKNKKTKSEKIKKYTNDSQNRG